MHRTAPDNRQPRVCRSRASQPCAQYVEHVDCHHRCFGHLISDHGRWSERIRKVLRQPKRDRCKSRCGLELNRDFPVLPVAQLHGTEPQARIALAQHFEADRCNIAGVFKPCDPFPSSRRRSARCRSQFCSRRKPASRPRRTFAPLRHFSLSVSED